MSKVSNPKHFVRINGKILGPFEIDQLKSLRDRGRLLPEHEVSSDRRQWVPADRLDGLFRQSKSVTETLNVTASEQTPDKTMPDAESDNWYYTTDGNQSGPVSLQKLRKLARTGKLQRDDLIWREGMSDWRPACEQPEFITLFDKQRSQTTGSDSVSILNSAWMRPTVLWDAFLDAARNQVSPKALDNSVFYLVHIGGFGMLAGMLAGFIFLLTVAIKEDSLLLMLISLLAILAFSALRYVAIHMSIAGDQLIRSTPNHFSSPAFLNCLAVLQLSTGVITAGVMIPGGVLSEEFLHGVAAFSIAAGAFLVFGMAARLTLHPGWLNLIVSPGARAGQEGVAIVSLLLKIQTRIGIISFAVGSVLGTCSFLAAEYCVLANYAPKNIAVWVEIGIVEFLVAGLLPLATYLGFALGSILLDVAQSVIETPQLLRKSAATSEIEPSASE